ncbi:DgyrCDS7607 [Dimorphilus gyrociliatus]|uniref:DgyrCDS7607 n=1 Tax=Dimorphilus gyrociliatus TaxID=2664684 RepID=A0A7I8VU35_9ANNE|nr:DgyrCDS7607 [Dimorphilus gyrociliatus]
MTGLRRVKRSIYTTRNPIPISIRLSNFSLLLRPAFNRRFKDVALEIDGKKVTDEFDPYNYMEGKVQFVTDSNVVGYFNRNIFVGHFRIGNDHFEVELAKQYRWEDNETNFHSILYNHKDLKPLNIYKNTRNQIRLKRAAFPKRKSVYYATRTDNEGAERRRTNKSEPKVCYMRLISDPTAHDYYMKQNAMSFSEATQEVYFHMLSSIKSANDWYRKETFATRGFSTTNIQIKPRLLSMNTSRICQKSPKLLYCRKNLAIQPILREISLANNEEFCLVHLFTMRQFEDSTMGLAFTARNEDDSQAGICGKYKECYNDYIGLIGKATMNTGVSTRVLYGKLQAPLFSRITFTHELGHNFGANHDEKYSTCSGNEDGRYIMWQLSLHGNQPNNVKFSSCSKELIAKILRRVLLTSLTAEGISRSNCLKGLDEKTCGNGIIEGDEECDCGYETDCIVDSKCCNPRLSIRSQHQDNKNSCKLRPYSNCSVSQGKCCDPGTCQFKAIGSLCKEETECLYRADCSGSNAICPHQIRKPNIETTCNGNRATCKDGNCTGSLCLLAESQPCTMSLTDRNSHKVLCQISCLNKKGDCVVLTHEVLANFQEFKQIRKVVGNVAVLYKPIGFSCNKSNGVCDMLSYCRDPTPDGPLIILANLLLGTGPTSLNDFMKKYWFTSVIIMLLPLLFFLSLLQFCDVQIGYIDKAVDKLSGASESFSQLSLNKIGRRVVSKLSLGKYETKSRLKLNRIPSVAKSAVSKLSKSKSSLVLDRIRILLDKEVLWSKAEEDIYKLSVRVRQKLYTSIPKQNSSMNDFNDLKDADKEYLYYVTKMGEDPLYILKNPFKYLWLSQQFRKRSNFKNAEQEFKMKRIEELSKKHFKCERNRQEPPLNYYKDKYDKFDILSFI